MSVFAATAGIGDGDQEVVAGATGDDVGLGVAGANEGARAGEGQVLQVGAERVARQVGEHAVRACIGAFGYDVAGIADDVGVVSAAAG